MVDAVRSVEAEKLISRVAAYLKNNQSVSPPPWALFAKTSVAREEPPRNPDWWFVRAASILRKLYVHGPLGVSRMRKFYGGRHRVGMMPPRFAKGGGAAVRKIMQQLEKAGFVSTVPRKGRVLTPAGVKLLEQAAKSISGKK
ncbi:MAG: 30S ribosomal protein S19e [Candidatus Caldarchaeum sp.]|nr:30S ribosomal protein S19e [Candidatus Caldarchaeum sp.]MDW7978793.1 30S ribosomal protein S19e [Candidatus Caldarchaeum sp.]MDW8359344.1 30S ribosomal protein S19e [Candidatus Caldarchaeum sp.]